MTVTNWSDFQHRLPLRSNLRYPLTANYQTWTKCSNVQTLIVSELTDDINKQTQGAIYKYKVNNNLSYGFLKNRIVTLFFSGNQMDETIKELKVLYKKHLIPIRPNRSNLRNVDKYRKRLKPKITKNQRDAM